VSPAIYACIFKGSSSRTSFVAQAMVSHYNMTIGYIFLNGLIQIGASTLISLLVD
jgi:hypothetical protein